MKGHQLYALCVYKRRPGGRLSYYRLSQDAHLKAEAEKRFREALDLGRTNGIAVELHAVRTEHSPTAPGTGVLWFEILGSKLRFGCVYREVLEGGDLLPKKLGRVCRMSAGHDAHNQKRTLRGSHFFMAPSNVHLPKPTHGRLAHAGGHDYED